MDAAFTSIAFAEPARAETNLNLLEQRLPGRLWAALPALLAQIPDPDGALNYLERYLRDAPAHIVGYLERSPAALHYLLVIFSYSRFLSETLIQQPELITWLHRPSPRQGPWRDYRGALDRLKSPEDLHEEFARFEASGAGEARTFGKTSFDQPPAVVLARFKRREYLRITLRDVLGLATLAETTLELSHLADVLLERALRISEQKLQSTFGTPQFTDPAGRRYAVPMAILSLGKLGGQELNYSSDIDLMFLYGHDGETSGGTAGATTNAEYFVRLAQAVLKLITEVTPEGASFRVDLRLRPQGSEGDLAVSVSTALDYYRHHAREWELQMLIKARCSAGDAETAREFLRHVQPLIYRPQFNLAAVEAVLNARQEMTRELRRRTRRRAGLARGPGLPAGDRAPEHVAEWNVKLSPGGIRDIEFLVQCLQRLYGGADPWVAAAAAGSTLVALQRLHDKNYLTGRDFFRLGTAYQFLRKVEHRLQLRDGLQRHTLPQGRDALDRLARRCGVEPAAGYPPRRAGEQLLHRIAQHFGEVREICDHILASRGASIAPPEAEETTDATVGPLLRRLRLESPGMARAAAEAAAGAEPLARRGLLRFLSSAVLSAAARAQLESHPEWIARAAEIFARSDLAVEMLSRHPEEVVVVADPGLAAFRGPWVTAGGAFDEGMAALRLAYRRSVLATVLRALLPESFGTSQPFETFAALTRLAEEALAGAMHLAAREVLGETDLAAPLAVIALGRLGTFEMDIGSDADLIFVADERLSVEDAERWRRLAERFVHVVSSHTREGLLFPVDTRLRPRGSEGEMVQSVAYLRDYFRTEAEGWEAATFLKARPVAGNFPLGNQAIADVQNILAERFRPNSGRAGRDRGPRELAQQLAHTRERLEKEGTGARAKGEFKKLSGGYYDIEYILAFLFLARGCAHPGGHVLRQIAALESAGALETAQAQTLRSAALLYRSVDHALRLVTGHPANHLPEPALAERVTRFLRLWGVPLTEDLEATIGAARRQIRTLYEAILRAALCDP